MAVYERSYRGYEGALTPEWSRFLTLPRYAFQQVFSSKAFVVFLVLCFLYPLFCGLVIYLPHNLSFLEVFQITPEDLHSVTAFWFPTKFMLFQGVLGFLMVVIVAPALISADLRNNALPLYLSRPFSRTEYVLGKMSVLLILLSTITWVPGLLLFLLQSSLMGSEWFADNLRIGLALFGVSWIWIVTLSLLSLAVSAYVKWKPVARIILVGMFFISSAAGNMINFFFATEWGRAIDLLDMIHVIWGRTIGAEQLFDFPLWGAAGSLAAVSAVCVLMLARRIRAYEVVR